MTSSEILVCEPFCEGLEHVPFNAGFIESMHHAWPDRTLTLDAEQNHGIAISAYCDGTLPVRHGRQRTATPAGLHRYRSEIRAIWRSLSTARERAIPVVFLSLSFVGILTLKVASRLRSTRRPVIAVLHAPLSTLVRSARGERGRWRRLIASVILRIRGADNLAFLVLGPSIAEALTVDGVDVGATVWSIDHPLATLPADEDTPSSPVRRDFAFVGVANPRKGMDRFVQIVQAVQAVHPEARFRLVGFDPGGVVPEAMRPTLAGYSRRPVPPEAFEEAMRSVRFVLWTGSPEHYALTASGSFVDAMRRGIPVIALRNDFIEHYAERFGPIGYIEPDADSLVRRVSRCAGEDCEPPYEELAKQASRCGRAFSPVSVGSELRGLIPDP